MVSSPTSLGKLFTILHWQTRVFVEKRLTNTGLTWGEFHILMRLFTGHNLIQSQLTQQLHVTKATTSKMLTKLERDGYVTRKHLPYDRRTFMISPTKKALALRQHLQVISHQWNDVLLASFSTDERNFLFSALTHLVNRAIQTNTHEEP
jgi:DNA-binding MarR family transcriptional regulator